MKRFTETTKWREVWFRKLTPTQKMLWLYLQDTCDAAGVFEFCSDLFSAEMGTKVSDKDVEALSSTIVKLDENRYIIVPFIRTQYKALSEDCRPHGVVFATLKKHGITLADIEEMEARKARIGYPIGYPIPYQENPDSQLYKDKDKDKEQDSTRVRKKTHASTELEMPHSSPEFAQAWADWVAFRKEIKKPVTPTMAKAQLRQLGSLNERRAIAMIEHTIGKGWQGLREQEGAAEMYPEPQERSEETGDEDLAERLRLNRERRIAQEAEAQGRAPDIVDDGMGELF
jgi:hypothetical protein